MIDFALPDVGEGLTEAEIVTWHVSVGDTVEVNTPLVDIETAKSVVEIPSPSAGRIQALHAREGETLAVGSTLVSIADGSAPADEVTEGAPAAETTPADDPGESRRMPAAPPQPEPEQPPVHPEPASAPEPVLVGTGPKPAAARRRHLRPRNTAPEPRVTATEPPTANTARQTRTPIKGVRKATAAAMVASAFTAPHATVWLTVDATRTVELIERLRRDRTWSGVRITPLSVAARALTLAITRHPEINARWDEARGEIVTYHFVNLGIAAATPRGLMVPNIKDADRHDLLGLANAIGALVETARAGAATPADLGGGTITITNLGSLGADGGTPILNPGEAAILALGAFREQPWVVDGQIVPRTVVQLALSFDHRLVDGALASAVLGKVGAVLNDPGNTLVQA